MNEPTVQYLDRKFDEVKLASSRIDDKLRLFEIKQAYDRQRLSNARLDHLEIVSRLERIEKAVDEGNLLEQLNRGLFNVGILMIFATLLLVAFHLFHP